VSDSALGRIKSVMAQDASPQNADSLKCSFCQKSQSDAATLVSNPSGTAYICNECIVVCHHILEEDSKLPSMAIGHPIRTGPISK
jgi:hypothetical protein